jgi:hypothetical protein
MMYLCESCACTIKKRGIRMFHFFRSMYSNLTAVFTLSA